MRRESGSIAARRLWLSTACWIATAAATPSAAPAKVAMIPSPRFFVTVPWYAVTASANRRSCVVRSASAPSSPSRALCGRTDQIREEDRGRAGAPFGRLRGHRLPVYFGCALSGKEPGGVLGVTPKDAARSSSEGRTH